MRTPSPDTLAVAVIVLNTLDCLLTLYGISYLGAHEKNPLMAALISQSPYLFAAFKLGLGTFVAGRMAAKESNLLLPAVVLLGGVVIWNILVGSVYMALRP